MRAAGFATVFAMHPDISALHDHRHDHAKYARKVMDIRKGVENDDAARVNLRRAIVYHMEKNNVHPDVVKTVKGQYDSLNARMTDQKYLTKLRTSEPIKYRARIRNYVAKRPVPRRQPTASSEARAFAMQLEKHKIPANADAFAIEEASKAFHFGSKGEATRALRAYLLTTFTPEATELAVTRRRLGTKLIAHRESNKVHRKRKQDARDNDVYLERQTSTSSISRIQKKKKKKVGKALKASDQVPESSALASSGQKVPAASPLQNILSERNPFEDSEWWNEHCR